MSVRSFTLMAMFAAAATGIAGCSNSSTEPNGPAYKPLIPTNWASAVTNTSFPLVPGTTYQYQGQTNEGLETTTVEVLGGSKVVNGVTATIVRDRVYLAGNLIEDTFDWYAQDGAGNVWYLGEDSKEIQNGQVLNTDGSWEWGKDGALPGIIMWADPAAHIGEQYRQEYYEGEAEDFAKVVAVGQAVDVAYGSFTNCIKTEDWNSLESGGREFKFYCPGVGMALEVKIEGGDRVELVSRAP
ncbi:MAG: hypothetical protein ACR2G6_10725 [Gemmatimonadaceae bacterium]